MLSFLLLSCTSGKNKKVKSFCSELKGSHVTILGCHWNGHIRMDVGDSRTGKMKIMMTWVLNSENGEIFLYNMGRKTEVPNPIGTQRDQLRMNPAELKEYLNRKKINDEAVQNTKATSGQSKLNNTPSQQCQWHQLKEPKENSNEGGRYDDVCIAQYESPLVEGYYQFSQSIKKIDEFYFPIAVEGLPILNWRMPFHSPTGWIKKGHLPKIFVTGTPQKQNSTAMNRIDFRYYFKETSLAELQFRPDWAEKK